MTSKLALFTTALLLSSAAAQADVSISSKPTRNMSCNAGVCTATAAKAMLNVGDLETMLASGDATVKTGSVALNIEIAAPLTWTGASRLTLDAQQSIIVKKPVTVAGAGALTIDTDNGGSGGEFIVQPKGSVQFWDLASSLIISGNSYTLVGDIKTLAADIAANPSGFYALAKPYDASVDGVYSSSPVSTLFAGIFEGLGNAISNLSITASGIQYVGLFSNTSSAGVLRDTVLTNANISSSLSGNYSAVGILAGRVQGPVLWSSSDGVVSAPHTNGYTYAAGLVGESEGSVANCKAKANVSGEAIIQGGLVGVAGDITVQNSSASGSISETGYGGDSFGGLVGIGAREILNSHATTSLSVSSAYASVGGIVGLTNGKIDSTFATGPVRVKGAYAYIGGLVGEAYLASITNSYATGKVTGSSVSAAGGLTGFFGTKRYQGEVDLESSYSTGSVRGATYLGGFIGYRKGHPTVTKFDYWNVGTSGVGTGTGYGSDKGITGLTDAQLKSRLPEGFDPNIWGQSPNINNGYPYLLANPPPK